MKNPIDTILTIVMFLLAIYFLYNNDLVRFGMLFLLGISGTIKNRYRKVSYFLTVIGFTIFIYFIFIIN